MTKTFDELKIKFDYLGIKNQKILWRVVYGFACKSGHEGYKFNRPLNDDTLEFVCGCGRTKLVKCIRH